MFYPLHPGEVPLQGVVLIFAFPKGGETKGPTTFSILIFVFVVAGLMPKSSIVIVYMGMDPNVAGTKKSY